MYYISNFGQNVGLQDGCSLEHCIFLSVGCLGRAIIFDCFRHVRKHSFDSLFINKISISKFDIALQHHYKWKTTATYVPFVTENELVTLSVINQPQIFRTRSISGDIISSRVPKWAKELIAEIHTTASWTVVVTVDGNINKHIKTDIIDRDHSYINTRCGILRICVQKLKAWCRPKLIHKNLEFWSSVCCGGSKWILDVATNGYISYFSQNLEYITGLL